MDKPTLRANILSHSYAIASLDWSKTLLKTARAKINECPDVLDKLYSNSQNLIDIELDKHYDKLIEAVDNYKQFIDKKNG